MDRAIDTKALIERHWLASEAGDLEAEHDIYAADAVLDYPQSGERFRGRARIQAQRGSHPADRHFAVRRILGHDNFWISECVIAYDGQPTYSVSIMELADGLVVHETQYFADPFAAAPDRAGLAEAIPQSGSSSEPPKSTPTTLNLRAVRAASRQIDPTSVDPPGSTRLAQWWRRCAELRRPPWLECLTDR